MEEWMTKQQMEFYDVTEEDCEKAAHDGVFGEMVPAYCRDCGHYQMDVHEADLDGTEWECGSDFCDSKNIAALPRIMGIV